MDKLGLALGSKEEVRTAVRNLAEKREPISDDMLRLMIGMGEFEEEFKIFDQGRVVRMAGRVGESALPFLNRVFDIVPPELQQTIILAAIGIGEPALPLLDKAFSTGHPDLMEEAAMIAVGIGNSALPLLKRMEENKALDLEVREKIKRRIKQIENDLNEDAGHEKLR